MGTSNTKDEKAESTSEILNESLQDALRNTFDLEAAFQQLEPVQRQLIKQINKILAETLTENFRSLVLIFSFLKKTKTVIQDLEDDYERPGILGEVKNLLNFDDDSEMNIWLGELNKKVSLFKKGLKRYRMTILNLLSGQESDEKPSSDLSSVKKTVVGGYLKLLCEGSGTSIHLCMKEFDESVEGGSLGLLGGMDLESPTVWNLGQNLEKIGRVLQFSRIDERVKKVRLGSVGIDSVMIKKSVSSNRKHRRGKSHKPQLVDLMKAKGVVDSPEATSRSQRSIRTKSSNQSNKTGSCNRSLRSSLSRAKNKNSRPCKHTYFDYDVSFKRKIKKPQLIKQHSSSLIKGLIPGFTRTKLSKKKPKKETETASKLTKLEKSPKEKARRPKLPLQHQVSIMEHRENKNADTSSKSSKVNSKKPSIVDIDVPSPMKRAGNRTGPNSYVMDSINREAGFASPGLQKNFYKFKRNTRRGYSKIQKFGGTQIGDKPQKLWHQRSRNSMILNDRSGFGIPLIPLLKFERKISKFAATLDGEYMVMLTGDNTLRTVDIKQQKIFQKPIYNFDKQLIIFGVELDYQNKIWISSNESLMLLDSEFKKLKEWRVEPAQKFNKISQPSHSTSLLKTSYDKMTMLWLKSNYEMLQISAKSLEKVAVFKSIVRTTDIERIMSIWMSPNAREVIYLSKKPMIGESVYFMDCSKGIFKGNWAFHNNELKGQCHCTVFDTDINQIMFLFGGYFLKFGRKTPFVSLYKKPEKLVGAADGGVLEHCDTKIIENNEGEVNHLLLSYHEQAEANFVVLGINESALTLRITDLKLEIAQYYKRLHIGDITMMRMFENRIVSCGEDGLIKLFTLNKKIQNNL